MLGPETGATTPNQFDRVVVLANPACTQVDRAHSLLSTLKASEFVGDRRIHVTTEPDPSATKDKLAETIREGDVVVVAGGDKTVGDAAEVLLERKIPLLPIWAGNANDTARMLNGKPRRHGLLEIIQHGNVVPLYPIQRQTLLPDGSSRTQTAVNYVGLGLSGLISGRVNEPGYRNSDSYHRAGYRRRKENMIGVSSALSRPEFELAWRPETPERFCERGDSDVLLDLSVAAGDRMGKRGGVIPVQLAERRLFVASIESGWAHMAIGIGRMALRQTAGQHLEPGEVLSFQLSTEGWSHTDGDAERLPATTIERIWQSPVPYLALSTQITPAEDA